MNAPRRPTADLLSLIGDTPLLEARRLETGPCRLFLKLESFNPGGSIKDRPALAMIEAFEQSGQLKEGGTLVEATAGNTGLGLALVAILKGYRLIIVLPDKMSREKIFHLKAMGAEVVMTRSDVSKGHPDYYQDVAERITKEIPGAVFVNQFGNPANPLSHETGTGPEIWEQMDHNVDAVVCGIGSSGSMTGIARFFARVSPETRMILADPEGSILDGVVKGKAPGPLGSWLVEGIGEDFIPSIAEIDRISDSYAISDGDSFAAARELLRKEGILAGSSSGTILAAALRWCRAQSVEKRVVALIPDSGNKYLSKMFNDYWMADQGFIARPRHNDLRDVIARRHDEGAAITIAPDDTLNVAYQRMKLYDISQLPVLKDETVVGIIDESDLLLAVFEDPSKFHAPVAAAMSDHIETVSVSAPLSKLFDLFARDRIAVVVDQGRFLGLVTRMDLVHHLRSKVDRE
ncbi:cystathionine beta-synthase [Alphaproteobacteria bacterium]|nr:cystathionine beta-synthase [Alphaproteobacteria bacterium]